MPPAESPTASARESELPRSAQLALARLHPAALGAALGCVLSCWVFGLTLWTAVAGDAASQRALGLLSQYWAGYRVSAGGATIGLLYALALGFILGYTFAATRNAIIRIYIAYLRRRAEQQQLQDMLDRLG